ncbi:MAG: Asp23/Gls24 family envelope stress response protein [Acidaminococcaceae bacterium]|nr:Asp23/Gls24 family envelope stress response protein [Acidaminococcaceae bacterium]
MADDKENINNSNAKSEDIPEEVGSVKVADEVLSIVASLAVAEIPGVAGMSGSIRGGISEMLGKKDLTKGVKVAAEGKSATLEVYVYIRYGYNIPDVAIAIQEKAKEAVESMTGYEVKAVNVHVEGIKRLEKNNIDDIDKDLDKEEAEEKKAKEEDTTTQDDQENTAEIEDEREETGTEEESKPAKDTKEADEK